MHSVDHSFEIRNIVFFRVQLYSPFPLRRGGTKKMRPHIYGPYRVNPMFGEVAYEIEFPEDSQIHNVFHVS